MQALLIPTPLPEPLTVGQFDTNFYVRAYLEDLFHSDNPDPVVDPIISTKLVVAMSNHAAKLVRHYL